MHFCFASPKGGVGKTTLSVIVASEAVRHGQSVTLIEADPNGHLRDWYEKGNCPSAVRVLFDNDASGEKLLSLIDDAQAHSDIVITDTEGTTNRRADLACQAADLVVIPLHFSELDLKGAVAAYNTLTRLESVTGNIIPRILVPNRVSSAITTKDERNIRSAIEQTDMPLCDPGVLEKAAYRQMIAAGCLLHDLPDHASVNNIQSAFDNAQSVLRAMLAHFKTAIN